MLLTHSWEGLLTTWGMYPTSSTCSGGLGVSDVCSFFLSFILLLFIFPLLLPKSLLFSFGTVCISVQKTEIRGRMRWGIRG